MIRCWSLRGEIGYTENAIVVNGKAIPVLLSATPLICPGASWVLSTLWSPPACS